MAGTNMAKSILSKLTYGNTTLKKGGRRRYKHKGGEDVVLEEFGKDDDVELDNLEGGRRRKYKRTRKHRRTRRHKKTRSRRHR
jgi:hypothetical protein